MGYSQSYGDYFQRTSDKTENWSIAHPRSGAWARFSQKYTPFDDIMQISSQFMTHYDTILSYMLKVAGSA